MTHEEIEQRELVDAWAMGRLSDEERQAFEDHFFACDECFEKARLAESFRSSARDAARSGELPPVSDRSAGAALRWLRPAFGFSLAGAAAMAGVVLWFAAIERPRLVRELAQQRALAENEARRSAELTRQMAMAQAPSREGNLPLVMLTASRDSGGNQIKLPAGASRLAVWAEVNPAAPFDSYSLQIMDAQHQIVHRLDGLARNSYGAIAASIAAENLAAGSYQLQIDGHRGDRATLVAEYRLAISR